MEGGMDQSIQLGEDNAVRADQLRGGPRAKRVLGVDGRQWRPGPRAPSVGPLRRHRLGCGDAEHRWIRAVPGGAAGRALLGAPVILTTSGLPAEGWPTVTDAP